MVSLLNLRRKLHALFLALTLPWTRPIKRFFLLGHFSCARRDMEDRPPGPYVVVGWFPRDWNIPVECFVSLVEEVNETNVWQVVRDRQKQVKEDGKRWDTHQPIRQDDKSYWAAGDLESLTINPSNNTVGKDEVGEVKVFRVLEGRKVFAKIRNAVKRARGWRHWFSLKELHKFGLYEVCEHALLKSRDHTDRVKV
jgi:hypothetical protein